MLPHRPQDCQTKDVLCFCERQRLVNMPAAADVHPAGRQDHKCANSDMRPAHILTLALIKCPLPLTNLHNFTLLNQLPNFVFIRCLPLCFQTAHASINLVRQGFN